MSGDPIGLMKKHKNLSILLVSSIPKQEDVVSASPSVATPASKQQQQHHTTPHHTETTTKNKTFNRTFTTPKSKKDISNKQTKLMS